MNVKIYTKNEKEIGILLEFSENSKENHKKYHDIKVWIPRFHKKAYEDYLLLENRIKKEISLRINIGYFVALDSIQEMIVENPHYCIKEYIDFLNDEEIKTIREKYYEISLLFIGGGGLIDGMRAVINSKKRKKDMFYNQICDEYDKYLSNIEDNYDLSGFTPFKEEINKNFNIIRNIFKEF